MGTSFSSQGSTANNPMQGLLGGPKLATNPFGDPNSGIIGKLNTATGLSTNSNYGKVTGVLAPTQPPQPTTPVKSISTPDGTTTTFHAPDTTGTQIPTSGGVQPDDSQNQFNTSTGQPNPKWVGASSTQYTPGTNGNNGTGFQQNLGNVQNAANLGNNGAENDAYNAALKKSILLNAAAGNVANAGLGGSSNTLDQNSTNALGTDYANIFRPQTTANLQGEKGILNPELNQAINAEAGVMNGILPEQQLGLGGAESIAGLTAPQPYGVTSTPYNPGTNSFGTLPSAGSNGTGSLSGVGSLLATQDIGGQVKNMQGSQAQAQALSSNLSDIISKGGFNPGNAGVFNGFINGVTQWVNGQAGDPQYQNAANLINEISSKYATILTPSGGSTTDYTNKIAHGLINGLASGQSIQQVMGDLDKNASDSINALQGSAGSSGTSSNSSSGTVSTGGYNFKQENGKWVPA